MAQGQVGSARELFEKLDAERSQVLTRARNAAALTIPQLMPPEGHTEGSSLPDPYQSLGSRGVNNLASKMLLALIPPGQKFFMLTPEDRVMDQLVNKMGIPRDKVKESLSMDENAILREIENSNIRAEAFEMFRYLVTLGDALVYLAPDGGMRVYRLDQYVVKRDREGNVLDVVVKETISPRVLDEETRKEVSVTDDQNNNDMVDVFTHIRRKKGKWISSQEINDKGVPKSRSEYPLKKPAWLALRWTAVPGEDYGRGLVEEQLGDLRSYEGLQKALVQGAANQAKLVWRIHPNSSLRTHSFVKAQNGEAVSAREDEVGAITTDKSMDLRGAMEQAGVIAERLQASFMMTQSIQRDAERVTATEIQMMAQELEDVLGGVYSVLAQEFQRPLVMRKMALLQKRGAINNYPDGVIEPQITTGIEALGRGGELKKLKAFVSDLAELGAEEALKMLNADALLGRIAAARGIDTDGLVKSQQQMSQENRQAMLQNLVQEAGPDAVKSMIDNMMQQQNGGR